MMQNANVWLTPLHPYLEDDLNDFDKSGRVF